MPATLKQHIVPIIIKLGHFMFDSVDKENIRKLEKLLGEDITDADDIIRLLPNAKIIEKDTIYYPHMWESGASYEVYKFRYDDKTYYAIKQCHWDTYSSICSIDIYEDYKDVKNAIRDFYEAVGSQITDAMSFVEDDEVYEELQEVKEYIEERISSLR